MDLFPDIIDGTFRLGVSKEDELSGIEQELIIPKDAPVLLFEYEFHSRR